MLFSTLVVETGFHRVKTFLSDAVPIIDNHPLVTASI